MLTPEQGLETNGNLNSSFAKTNYSNQFLPILIPTPNIVSVDATMKAALLGNMTMSIETIEFQAAASATPSMNLKQLKALRLE